MWRISGRKTLQAVAALERANFPRKFAENVAKPVAATVSPFALPPDKKSVTNVPENLPFAKLQSAEVVVNKEATAALASLHEEELKRAVPFDDVPGPAFLQKISKFWSIIPVLGSQVTTSSLQYALSASKIFGSQLSWGNNLGIFRYLLDEYGPVVRLHGPFGGDVVIVSRPEHAGAVFQNEGPYPIRSSLDCIEKYRLQYRMYKNSGPFVMHGPEWETLRNKIEPALTDCVDKQFDRVLDTSDNLVKRIQAIKNRQLEVPKNFKDELDKWGLECLCGLIFNKKMAFLLPQGLNPAAETAVLAEAVKGATESIRKCEFGFHLWKLWETPAWKGLVEHCDTIDHVLVNHLKKAENALKEARANPKNMPKEFSLIDTFLVKDNMNTDDILTVLLDMILLGVNMCSHSAGFLMYHLARNPRAQQKLYQEITRFPEKITRENLSQMTYLRSCLHESLRLKPPMPVLSRILTRDITIHHYKIPKGTFVLIATNLSSLREEYFEDALKFKPERWSGQDANKDMEALATIPFGVGPKACLAKSLAEMQISMLIIKILRKFRVEYHYGDIESNNKLLAAPTRPLNFRFVDRS